MDPSRYGNIAANTSNTISARIWRDFPFAAMKTNPSIGQWMHDDFDRFPTLAATTSNITGEHAGARVFLSGGSAAGGSITQSATEMGGVVTLTGGDTDNETAGIEWDGLAALIASGSIRKLAMEARFKVSSIATSFANLFIGWTLVGSIAEDYPLADTPANSAPFTTTADAVGFFRAETAPASLGFGHIENGTTQVIDIAAAATLVANTYIKAGFVIDFDQAVERQGEIVINGVPSSTYLTNTVLTASAFPKAVTMCPAIQAKNSAGSATDSVSIDWIRAGYLRR